MKFLCAPCDGFLIAISAITKSEAFELMEEAVMAGSAPPKTVAAFSPLPTTS